MFESCPIKFTLVPVDSVITQCLYTEYTENVSVPDNCNRDY